MSDPVSSTTVIANAAQNAESAAKSSAGLVRAFAELAHGPIRAGVRFVCGDTPFETEQARIADEKRLRQLEIEKRQGDIEDRKVTRAREANAAEKERIALSSKANIETERHRAATAKIESDTADENLRRDLERNSAEFEQQEAARQAEFRRNEEAKNTSHQRSQQSERQHADLKDRGRLIESYLEDQQKKREFTTSITQLTDTVNALVQRGDHLAAKECRAYLAEVTRAQSAIEVTGGENASALMRALIPNQERAAIFDGEAHKPRGLDS